ncbi:hypothetical protein MHYP_G00240400 [Metynnis hypsauchen]
MRAMWPQSRRPLGQEQHKGQMAYSICQIGLIDIISTCSHTPTLRHIRWLEGDQHPAQRSPCVTLKAAPVNQHLTEVKETGARVN